MGINGVESKRIDYNELLNEELTHMAKEFLVYILYLAIIWYVLKGIISVFVYGNKKNSEEEREENHKKWMDIWNFVCGFILVVFIINLFMG